MARIYSQYRPAGGAQRGYGPPAIRRSGFSGGDGYSGQPTQSGAAPSSGDRGLYSGTGLGPAGEAMRGYGPSDSAAGGGQSGASYGDGYAEQPMGQPSIGNVAGDDGYFGASAPPPAGGDQRGYAPPPPPPQTSRGYVDTREPLYTGKDPSRMFRNDRQRAVAMGDMVDQDLRDFGSDENSWRRYYRDRGIDSYAGIAAGEGGYRPGEQAEILGRERLNGLQLTPEERESFFLNDDERKAIMGDPDRAGKWFDPEWYDKINTEGNKRLNESVDESGRRIRDTFDPNALSLSKGYRGELQGAVGKQAAGVRGALNRGSAGVRGAIDRDRLTLDPNFAKDYQMTNRDVDDTIQEAALTQGNVSAGRADAIRREAAGTDASPLALAAGINELTTRGDQQANRAMLNARIAARAEQAGRRKDVEGMRLDAERGYAGMKSDAELALSGREAGAEMDLGDRDYAASKDYEQERLGTERDKQKRSADIETNVADRNFDAVNKSNSNTMNNARYIGEQGEAVTRRADDRSSDRAYKVAENRQDAAKYGSESALKRGMYIDDATAKRTAGFADARRDDEKEYRGYLTGQQHQANQNVTGSQDRRIRNYGQAGELAGDASKGALNSRNSGFWRNIGTAAVGSFAGGLGGGLGTGIAKNITGR